MYGTQSRHRPQPTGCKPQAAGRAHAKSKRLEGKRLAARKSQGSDPGYACYKARTQKDAVYGMAILYCMYCSMQHSWSTQARSHFSGPSGAWEVAGSWRPGQSDKCLGPFLLPLPRQFSLTTYIPVPGSPDLWYVHTSISGLRGSLHGHCNAWNLGNRAWEWLIA